MAEKGGGKAQKENCLTQAEMEEIRVMYRDAKYKRQQIGILSEMYLVSKDTIAQVLGLSKELDRVVQWYGYEDNRTIPKDPTVKEFIGDWMAEIVLPKKRGKKKDRKQAPAGQEKNRQPLAAAV